MSARETVAPKLAVELREAIRDWFAARGTPMESQVILDALADLLAEQVAANPTPELSDAALKQFHQQFFRLFADAVRINLGGVSVKLVRQ
jgi:hypothetical protein